MYIAKEPVRGDVITVDLYELRALSFLESCQRIAKINPKVYITFGENVTHPRFCSLSLNSVVQAVVYHKIS